MPLNWGYVPVRIIPVRTRRVASVDGSLVMITCRRGVERVEACV